MRQDEIKKDLVHPIENRNIIKKKVKTTRIRFNKDGMSDQNSKNDFPNAEVCAMHIDQGPNSDYKIKALNGTGALFDPQNLSNRYSLKSKDQSTGDDMFKLKIVSKDTFTAYIKYLKTGITSHLRVAERINQ